jgi:hypothetical protein
MITVLGFMDALVKLASGKKEAHHGKKYAYYPGCTMSSPPKNTICPPAPSLPTWDWSFTKSGLELLRRNPSAIYKEDARSSLAAQPGAGRGSGLRHDNCAVQRVLQKPAARSEALRSG